MKYTLSHPRLAGVTVEVDGAAARDAHERAGWVPPETPESAPQPAAEPVDDDPLE